MSKQSKFNEKILINKIVDCLKKHDGVSHISPKGIKLQFDNDQLTVNAHIRVYYGINIPQLSYDIQSNAKTLLTDMQDVPIGGINVFVDGIDETKE